MEDVKEPDEKVGQPGLRLVSILVLMEDVKEQYDRFSFTLLAKEFQSLF